jgi:PhoH-like ATPase
MSDKESKVYVLDTNILLNDAHNLFTISQNGENLIVLPETVIDEIDTKKTGFDEINFQAREFGRILSNAVVKDIKKEHEDNVSIVSLEVDGIEIDIVSFEDYKLGSMDRSIINDRKIIAVAHFAQEYYDRESVFITLDVMCRTRAISLKVKTESLSYKKKDHELEFIKHMELEDLGVHGRPIKEIDPEYKVENYCYKFTRGDKELFTVIKKGKIHAIDVKELDKSDVKPRNEGQKWALQGMLDIDYNIVLVEALAGSGKTLLALSAGMRNIDMRRYDKIIYIRNSIDSVDRGEEVGFLSGNDEKFKVYNYPLFDTLDFIVRAKRSKKKDTEKEVEEKIEQLIERYKIDTMWVGAIRGRTISNAYVIVDEIQNFSKKSLQTVLSRLDANCKVVCIGSNRQIDNIFVNKYTNGLNVLLEATSQTNEEVNIFATKLDIVERGAITAWTERIFS